MKREGLRVILTALLISVTKAFGADLMPNGGFEAAPVDGRIVGWSSVSVDALGAGRQSERGLMISQDDSGGVLAYVSDAVAVPEGVRTLYASGFVTNAKRVGGEGGLVLSLLFFDADARPLGESVIEKTKETPDVWRKVRAEIALPEGTHHVRVSFKLDHVNGAGGLDDVVLDTEDFGRVSVAFHNYDHVLTAGNPVRFSLTSTRSTTVCVRDYDDRIVREIAVEPGRPAAVVMENVDPGIYWLTDTEGAYIDVFASVVPVPKPADSEQSRFGVHYGYIDRDPSFVKSLLDIFEKIGAVWVRTNTNFDTERESWPQREAFIDGMRARGLQSLTFFEDYNFPEAAKPRWSSPLTLELVAWYASHYRGRVRYLEVWNEANGNTVEEYFAFHKAFHQTVKAANPEAQVVQTGIASTSFLGEWGMKYMGAEFQDRLLELGCDRYTDVYNLHFYPWQWQPEEIIGQFMAVYRRHGVSKPVWVTENGIAMNLTNLPQQRAGAEYLVRSAVTCLSLGIDKYFWFIALDHPVWDFGLVAGDARRPKAGLVAYATAARMLDGTDFVSRPSGGTAPLQAFRFRGENREVFVLWSDRPGGVEADLGTLGLPVGEITAVDLMGRSRSVDRNAKLTVTARPQFLVIKTVGR